MENLEKLPKWAQSHILRLNNKIEGLEEQLKQFSGDKPSKVTRTHLFETTPLPEGDTYTFDTGKGKISVRLDGSTVVVSSNSCLDFVVSPVANNMIKLKYTEY